MIKIRVMLFEHPLWDNLWDNQRYTRQCVYWHKPKQKIIKKTHCLVYWLSCK